MGEGDNQYRRTAGFMRLWGDHDNYTHGIAMDAVSKALHIFNPADAKTDWNVSAFSDPTVMIHCEGTNAATDYIKIWHDDTDATIDCYGATALNFGIGGTNYMEMTTAAITPTTTDGMTLGTTSLMYADLFLAEGAVINFNASDVTLTHSDGQLSVAATWTTAPTTGRPFISTLTQNGTGGGYFNALKGQLTFGASGSTAGVASAICAEVTMSTGNPSGTYAALELEMTYQDTAGTLAKPCFIYANNTGTAADTYFDVWGAFMILGTGLTAGADNILSAGSQTLKMRMGALQATVRHLLMSTTENAIVMGASAAPVGDFYYYGTLASSYIHYDVSADRFVVQQTFASDANVSTYQYGQYIGLACNTDLTTGKYVAGLKIAMEGTGNYDSGSTVAPLWIDYQNSGTNSSGAGAAILVTCQASACFPQQYLSMQSASPGPQHLFRIGTDDASITAGGSGGFGGTVKKISIDLHDTEYFIVVATSIT